MARNGGIEDLEEIDGGVQDASIPGDPLDKAPKKEAREEPPKRMSIREAIADARDKHSDDSDDGDDDTEVKEDKKPHKLGDKKDDKQVEAKDGKPNKKLEVKKPVAKVETVKDDNDEEDAGDDETSTEEKDDTEKEVKPTKPSFAAPKGWTKEEKQLWNNLPPAIQTAVARREDEVSKGFKEYGEKTRRLEGYENVIQQYAPDYQNYGVQHPAQLVERAFQWVKALRNPDKNVAVNSFKQLAASHGIEEQLKNYYSGTSQDNSYTPDNNTQEIPPQVLSTVQELRNEIEMIKNRSSQTAMEAANQSVANWAKDKPHFDQVRTVMHQLLASGSIPLKDGQLDLDEAYTRAVRQDPELYEELLQERLAAKEKELADAAAQKAAKQKQALERARKANVSLRPGAPSSTQTKKDGPASKLSARESIRLAMQEVRGT